MKTFKVSDIMQPLHNRVMQVGSSEDTEYLKQVAPPFSGLEDRVKETDFQDQLLHANIITMKEAHRSDSGGIRWYIDEAFRKSSRQLSEEGLIDLAVSMGKVLEEKGFYFDTTVRIFCNKARRAGFNEDGLQRKVETGFLKGLKIIK